MIFLLQLNTRHIKIQIGVFIQYYKTSDYYFRNRSLEGRSYFPLPEELNSMGGSINIQIEVNECL